MPVAIDPKDLAPIARSAGKSGKVMPDFAVGVPDLEDAYYEGAGTTRPTPATKKTRARARPKATPKAKTSTPPAPTSASPKRLPPPPRGTGARASWKGTTGSFGGLLLALFLYPVVLAGIKSGPSGSLAWIEAKFLNRVTAPKNTGPASGGIIGVPVGPGINKVPKFPKTGPIKNLVPTAPGDMGS